MAITDVGVIETKKCTDDEILKIIDDIKRGVQIRVISSKHKIPFSVVAGIFKQYKSLSFSAQSKTLKASANISYRITEEKELKNQGISILKEDKNMGHSHNSKPRKYSNKRQNNQRNHGGKGRSFNKKQNKSTKQIINYNNTNDELNEVKNQSDINQKVNNKTNTDIISCGLIKDRHDMPVDKFIFNEIQESIMFKYDELDKIVEEFIKKEIPFKEDEFTGEIIGAKSLQVYVTGLSCCTGSVIKICNKYKVNLTLMHFNNRNGSYFKQVILNEFGKGYEKKLFPDAASVELHGLDIPYMKENQFYTIRTVKLYENASTLIKFDIFKDQKELWLFYGKLLSKEMPNAENKVCIYLDISCIDTNKEGVEYVRSVNKISAIYSTDTTI